MIRTACRAGLLALAPLAFATLAPLGDADAAETERYGEQKVVYHINGDGGPDGKGYRAAMGNIQNHINAVGAGNLEVKVVMHGDGLGLLARAKTDDALMTRVSGLKGQNVAFAVCANTLRGRGIDPEEDLYDVWAEDIVPSGVAELSRLQMMGYTYIRP